MLKGSAASWRTKTQRKNGQKLFLRLILDLNLKVMNGLQEKQERLDIEIISFAKKYNKFKILR